MQSSTDKPRPPQFAKIWSFAKSRWEIRKISDPRWPSDSQKEEILSHAKVLGQAIKLNTLVYQSRAAEMKRGPEALIFFYLKLLRMEGYDSLRETLAEKELFNYIWELGRYYRQDKISWEAFEDEVELWYLAMSHKRAAFNVG